jgi:arylsulfatase A-like enzyme
MVGLLLIGVSAAGASRCQAARPDLGPNVLVILVDDLGWGDLSSFGAPDLQTPQLDRLVRRGMKLTQFYANCTVCSPTRAAVLAGRFPDCVGVPGVIRTNPQNSWGYLDPQATLLPAVLTERGYHTAIIGKWHLGLDEPNLPTLRGFQFFHGFLGDMMDDYWTHRRGGKNFMRRNREPIEPEGHATDVFTRWSIDYLQSRRTERQPFFLYLAYNAPHFPIQPPPEWLGRYRSRHPDVPLKRAKNCALIEHLDAAIGRVIGALAESDLASNTLVFFTSDNGGALRFAQRNEPWTGGKQDMLEGGIRVPTCAVWPDRIPPGTETDRVAMTMDLYPTICEATGAAVPDEVDGRSILPTLLGQDQPAEDRYLFWVRLEGGRYGGRPYYGVRHGDWKLIQNNAAEPLRLYNLAADPKETTDRSQQNPAVYHRLKQALDKHIAQCAAVPWQPPSQRSPQPRQ